MQCLRWLRSAHDLSMTECAAKCGGGIQMRSTTAAERGGIHSGKVAIITGSTDGIGLDIARRLAQAGASVVVSSRKKDNVERAVAELRAENLSVSGVICHVGKEEDRQRLVNKALEEYGGIDYMISHASVNPFVGNILDSTAEIWDKVFDVNVKSMFLMAQLSVPHMRKRGGGSIIFTSSVGAYNPMPMIGPYCVSKTALLGLTKVLAKSLAPMNIRVNCLAPGFTETKFAGVLFKDESLTKEVMKNYEIQRIAKPSEYGGIVSFLCSPDASYINGETIAATGGAISHL